MDFTEKETRLIVDALMVYKDQLNKDSHALTCGGVVYRFIQNRAGDTVDLIERFADKLPQPKA